MLSSAWHWPFRFCLVHLSSHVNLLFSTRSFLFLFCCSHGFGQCGALYSAILYDKADTEHWRLFAVRLPNTARCQHTQDNVLVSVYFSCRFFFWTLCVYFDSLIGKNLHFFPPFSRCVNTQRRDRRFGKRFETALLVQSIVMILAMFGLLELCVRVRNSNLIIQGRKHYFAGKCPFFYFNYLPHFSCTFWCAFSKGKSAVNYITFYRLVFDW